MLNDFTVDVKNKLRNMVCFAYEHSVFYRTLYQENGVDVYTCKIPDDLPIVTQKDLSLHATEFKTDILLNRVCASSGSGEFPKLMFRSASDFEQSVKNQIQLMKWSNICAGDRIGIVQPAGLWGYTDIVQEAAKQMQVMVVPFGGVDDYIVLNLINRLEINVLDIAPSRLQTLLNINEEKHITDFQMKSIMCSGEILEDKFRNYVWEKYRIPIYNQYGSEEADALGGEIKPGEQISLFTENFVFEILDKNRRYVDDSGTGCLVLSSLYHKGTPLIRYELGDICKILSKSEGKIQILGREKEFSIIYDSVKLYPYQINDVLKKFYIDDIIWQCRLITSENNKTIAEVKICNKPIIEKENILMELEKASIDIKTLCKNGVLIFKLITGTPILTGRGKRQYILDQRSR